MAGLGAYSIVRLVENFGQDDDPPVSRTKEPVQPVPVLQRVFTDAVNNRSYTRGKFLGNGGFARVFQVTDNVTKELFACKIVSKGGRVRPTDLAQEIRIHRELAYHCIVKFISYFEDVDNVYIILELCKMNSLMEILLRLIKNDVRMTEAQVQWFLRQIMYALNYLQGQGIVHRDLKPGNVFLDSRLNVKIGDFGYATKCVGDAKSYRRCGTTNYMPPETLMKQGQSFAADMWSSGCILYTLCFGRMAFSGKTVEKTYESIKNASYKMPSDGRVSEEARVLINQMLQLDPALRPTPSQVLQSDFLTKVKIPKALTVDVAQDRPEEPQTE